MASKLTEFLVASLVPVIEQIAEGKLVEVLQEFHDKNPEQYEVSIKAGHVFIQPLIEHVTKTKGKLDDGIVEALHNAIDTSASLNGIELTEPED